jgi:hypothetical protein
VGEAFAWGLVAASSLLVGGLLALHYPIGLRPLGLIMAFGAGVLIRPSPTSSSKTPSALQAGAVPWRSA